MPDARVPPMPDARVPSCRGPLQGQTQGKRLPTAFRFGFTLTADKTYLSARPSRTGM